MIIQTIAEAARLLNEGIVSGMRGTCFRCGELLAPPLVVWAGADATDTQPDVSVITLHPECAEAVGAALIHDGHKAQGKESLAV